MNILYVDHYAGSQNTGMEYRPYYLAKEWVRKGHKVTILAASYSHLRSIQPKVKGMLTSEFDGDIEYLWVWTPSYTGNSVMRVVNIFCFVTCLLLNVRWLVRKLKPDVVIASSTYPFDNFPVNRIAKKARAKHVYEIHDLWPLSPMELGGYSEKNLFIRFMQYSENFAFNNCDHVISILPKTFEHAVNHGLIPEKWNYIPNGISMEDWNKAESVPEKHMAVIKELKSKNLRLIGYVGTHGVANALEYFIDAARLSEDKTIAFILVGKGIWKNDLISRAQGLENIFFLDPVPKHAVPNLLRLFDILYIGWNRNPLYRFGISPNKLFDYLMSGKPVIHSVEAGNDIVAECGCGLSILPESPPEILRAITEMFTFSEDELIEIGARGKDYVLVNHDYTVLSEKFLTYIS